MKLVIKWVILGGNGKCIDLEDGYRCECSPGYSQKAPMLPCEDFDEVFSILYLKFHFSLNTSKKRISKFSVEFKRDFVKGVDGKEFFKK